MAILEAAHEAGLLDDLQLHGTLYLSATARLRASGPELNTSPSIIKRDHMQTFIGLAWWLFVFSGLMWLAFKKEARK